MRVFLAVTFVVVVGYTAVARLDWWKLYEDADPEERNQMRAEKHNTTMKCMEVLAEALRDLAKAAGQISAMTATTRRPLT